MCNRRRAWLLGAAVTLLLAAHAWFAWSGKRDWGTTNDEIAHLVAGRAYWHFNDYRLQPENGNLPQRWAALPATLAHVTLPPADDPAWTTSDVWVLGHSYLFELGHDVRWLLASARAMNLVWSVGCGLLVFFWARHLFGASGGLVALAFFCADPTFLAHGALATSDVCLTFFLLAAATAWWWHLQRLDLRSGVVSTILLGLALVAKFSAVLLAPIGLLLVLARFLFRSSRALPPRPGRRLLASIAAHVLGAALVVWAFYGFRYRAVAPDAPPFVQFISAWPPLLSEIGWQGRFLEVLRSLHALPEAFLYGYNHVLAYSQQRAAFLDGEYSVHGWVRFFPLAFLYKTPLALLLALPVAAAIAFARLGRDRARWTRHLWRAAPLLALFAVYAAFSLASHLNIGQRHILPLYPVLFVFTGALGWRLRSAPWSAGLATAVLLASAVIGVARVHPHELAFFNVLAGGPARGYQRLADSSLDWGQDLPGLERWLATHRGTDPVFLSYFGSDEPDHYQINAVRLPFVNGFRRPPVWYEPKPGLYCISATMLQAVYLPGRGPWTPQLEHEFRSLRALEPRFAAYAHDPAQRRELQQIWSPQQWEALWTRYDLLRFLRLCHYLRTQPPVASIGWSIFVYRLTEPELAAILER